MEPNAGGLRARSRTAPALVATIIAVLLAAALPPAASAARRTYTLRHGPITVGGFQTKFPIEHVRSPRRSGYIVGMQTRVVDRRGRPLSIRRVMLHHVVFINLGHRGGPSKRSTCEGRGGEPFYGTGEERQRLILPPGYGYRVDRRDRWRTVAMYMSHTRVARDIYLEYRVTIDDSTKLEPVRPLWLRASGCDPQSTYSVPGGGPPGSIHEQSYAWKMPISGRIVAAGAHMHGSAKAIAITQPRCGERTLIDHRPLWGMPDDIVNRVRPVLHEPGPIATGYFLSKAGIPIRRGEVLRVVGRYDGELPHPLVMAITHIYVARDSGASRTCDPLPADAHTYWTRTDGRWDVPPGSVPLTGLDAHGDPVEIARAAGPEVIAGDSASVDLVNSLFSPPNLSIARGGSVTWFFRDRDVHVVLLANGPRAVDSPLRRAGGVYSQSFDVPGTYNLFCYLHPVTMHQTLTVRP
jgi:plastocyanin